LTVLKCINGDCTDEQRRSLHFGAAVQRIQNLWGSCVDWGGEDISSYITEAVACPAEMKTRMEAVKQFFIQNHKNYLAIYNEHKCKGTVPLKPTFNYWEAMMHIY